jgi:hypothetical protein
MFIKSAIFEVTISPKKSYSLLAFEGIHSVTRKNFFVHSEIDVSLISQEKLRERERETRKRKEREEQEMERVRLKIRRKEAAASYQALLVEKIKDHKVNSHQSCITQIRKIGN